MRNIEIKTRLRDRTRVEAALRALGARDAGIESQHDLFWSGARGRLKLRRSSRDGACLIHYRRSDAAAPRASDYQVVHIEDADALERLLDDGFERCGEVQKERHLFWIDNVRVHLDAVAGLGDFVELEAIVGPEHPEAEGHTRCAEILAALHIEPADWVTKAYRDLLPADDPGTRPR